MSVAKHLVAILATVSQVCHAQNVHESGEIIRHVLKEIYQIDVCRYKVGPQSGILTESNLWAAKFSPHLTDDEAMWMFYEKTDFVAEPFCFDAAYDACLLNANEVEIEIRYSVPVEIDGDIFLYLEWNFSWEEGEGAVVRLSGLDYTIKGVYEIWRS